LRRHGDLRWALAGYNAGLTASLRARAGETRLWGTTDAFVAQTTSLLARARVGAATTPASTDAPSIR
jgi:hypothetical protein